LVKIPIKNDRDRPVHFTEIRKSCSCAGADLDQSTIAPGDVASLSFSATVSGRTGPQAFFCELLDDTGISWPVQVSAKLYDTFRLSEQSVVLGIVEPSAATVRRISASYFAKDRAALADAIELVEAPKKVRVRIGDPNTSCDEQGVWCRTWPIELTVLVGREPGPDEGIVSFKLPDSPGADLPSACIQWCVRSDYKLTPSRVFFPATTTESSPDVRSAVVKIKRHDGKPVGIKNITGAGDGIRARFLKSTEANSIEVQIEVDGTVTCGVWRELTVSMIDDSDSIVKIPVAVAAVRK
jgi:hypothetical protein